MIFFMKTSMCIAGLCCILGIAVIGCSSSRPETVHYSITTQNSMKCCRNLTYTTESFKAVRETSIPGDSVRVILHPANITATCDKAPAIPLTISNGTEHDIYIPFSKELSGDTIKLYPWRLLTIEWKPIRVARQIQYGDLLERTDALLRFLRLPAGTQADLTGIIPPEWICAEPQEPVIDYLEKELDPHYYSNYSRWLRSQGTRRPDSLTTPVGLRYDITYTTLDYIEKLPVLEQSSSSANDSIAITLAVQEQPAEFINSSQELATSNVITLELSN